MSLLSVCQNVSRRIGVESPLAVIGNTEDTIAELLVVVKEASRRILDANDWQTLTRLQTMTGDGTTYEFALPSDFYRMAAGNNMHSSRLRQPFVEIGRDDWLDYENRQVQFVYGVWTKLGDEILVKPVMATGETLKYYYQSNAVWSGAANTAEPVLDADTYRLDERLLELGTVWAWKHYKGLPYEQHYMEYQKALGHAIERDRGPRRIDFGPQLLPRDVKIAYPWNVTPYPS